MEREIRAEFQNLHNFLDEEEERDLERLRKERDRRVKMLKDRERKIAMQGRDLERAIETLNSKLAEDDSPKLLKVLLMELLYVCFPGITKFCQQIYSHQLVFADIYNLSALYLGSIGSYMDSVVDLTVPYCIVSKSRLSSVQGEVPHEGLEQIHGTCWMLCGTV